MPSPAEMIEFLLTRKYPDHKDLKHRIWVARRLGTPNDADVKLGTKAAAYEASLAKLSPEKLEAFFQEENALHEAELAQWLAVQNEKIERDERARFFNQAYANADLAHWSKAAHWTLDEAVALSFGRDPEVVKWDLVKEHVRVSRFAKQYSRVRDLAMRAKQWAQLYDPVLPGIFLAWAKRFDISYPAELEERVVAYGHSIQDWRTLYDQKKAQYDELHAHAKKVIDEANSTIRELNGEVENLVKERDALLRQQDAADRAGELQDPTQQPLGTRAQNTLLKLVIGMAIAGYRYDPAKPRSPVTEEIVSDLAKLGISISHDTVRKWLKEGTEQLPLVPIEDATTKPN